MYGRSPLACLQPLSSPLFRRNPRNPLISHGIYRRVWLRGYPPRNCYPECRGNRPVAAAKCSASPRIRLAAPPAQLLHLAASPICASGLQSRPRLMRALRNVKILSAALLLVAITGTAGFHYIEHWSWFDGFYMVLTTPVSYTHLRFVSPKTKRF